MDYTALETDSDNTLEDLNNITLDNGLTLETTDIESTFFNEPVIIPTPVEIPEDMPELNLAEDTQPLLNTQEPQSSNTSTLNIRFNLKDPEVTYDETFKSPFINVNNVVQETEPTFNKLLPKQSMPKMLMKF